MLAKALLRRVHGLTFPGKLNTAQKIVVLLVALFACASSVPDIVLPWSDVGTVGFTADDTGEVNRIIPGGAADRAGIRLKQHIDVERAPPESRRYLLDLGYAGQGASATFVVADGDKPGPVTMTALPAEFSPLDSIAAVLFGFAYLTLILTGVGLLVRRPSLMTFAFYCYCVMTANWSWLASAFLPWRVYQPWASLEALLYVLNWLPLAFFALVFPSGTLTAWRTRAAQVLCVLFGVALVASFAGVVQYWSHPTGSLAQSLYFEPVAGLLLALALMVANFVRAEGRQRVQLGIVTVALLVGNLGTDVSTIATFAPGVPIAPIWFINMLAGLNIIVSITVAFAILRYRLFGIIVSRTLAYTILTSTFVIANALIDHMIGRAFAETFVDVLIDLVLAIALGATRKRLEQWIYHWLFSARRRARSRLLVAAGRLAQANSVNQIGSLIVSEPLKELDLGSAALFHRTRNGFTRGESRGWDAAAPNTLERGDPLVERLQQEQRPLPVCDTVCEWALLPVGEPGSVVAIPVVIRGEIEAIVFYGPQESGEKFDRYDIETLQALSAKAGVAYDRLEVESERRTVKELRRVLNTLRGLWGAQ
jgi:hypothetical protein